jgi:hypothetical protein
VASLSGLQRLPSYARAQQTQNVVFGSGKVAAKTAIPLYFPKTDSISLLLPIALVDDEVVDMALVTNKMNATTYYASTVLPLDMAYTNARLVCRPDSDWLSTEIRVESDEEEALDE